MSLLLALSWGGVRYPWAPAPSSACSRLSARVLGRSSSGACGRAAEPLIPPGVLHNPVVRMGTLAACFGMGTYIGLTIYLPVYFEAVRGLSASHSGLALIPLMVGTVAGATALRAASMCAFRSTTSACRSSGLGFAFLGTAVLAWSARRFRPRAIEILLRLHQRRARNACCRSPRSSIQNAVHPHELGTATGTANFFRSLGGAFIVAIFGAIVLGATGLAKGSLHAERIVAPARQSGADLAAVFRYVFAAACIGFALALASSS